MSRNSIVGMGESFDILVNKIRYIKYFLLFNVGFSLLSFLISFSYFISKNQSIIYVLKETAKYYGYLFVFWLKGNFGAVKKPEGFYYAQDIYNKYFHLIFHSNAFYYSLFIAFAVFIISFFVVKTYAMKLSSKYILRGIRVYKMGKVKDLGRLIKPKDESKHVIVIGTTGSGKTQAMTNIMKNRIQSAKNIIFDTKGDFLERFFKKGIDSVLNPLDIRSSRWNFMYDIEDKADIDLLASSFIPSHQDDKNRYFTDNAALILSSFFEFLYKKGIKDNSEIRKVVEDEIFHKSDSGILKDLTSNLNVGSSVSLADTLSTLRVNLSFMKILGYEPKSNPEFSINKWINSDANSNLYITVPQDKISTTENFNAAFFSVLFAKLMARKDRKDVDIKIFIDELANIGTIRNLDKALSFLRSKGVAIYLSTQSLEGLKSRYKEHEIANILNNCNTIISFAANDDYTADKISRMIGETQIETTGKNDFSTPQVSKIDSVNINRNRVIERAVLPSEIMVLDDLEFYMKLSRKWYKGKLQYMDIPKNGNIDFFLKNKALNLSAKSEVNESVDAKNNSSKTSENKGDNNITVTSTTTTNAAADNTNKSKSIEKTKENNIVNSASRFLE